MVYHANELVKIAKSTFVLPSSTRIPEQPFPHQQQRLVPHSPLQVQWKVWHSHSAMSFLPFEFGFQSFPERSSLSPVRQPIGSSMKCILLGDCCQGSQSPLRHIQTRSRVLRLPWSWLQNRAVLGFGWHSGSIRTRLSLLAR